MVEWSGEKNSGVYDEEFEKYLKQDTTEFY